MSSQLITCLIAVAANLAGMLVIHAIAAHLFTRLAWNGRGIVGLLVTILAGQLFWIAPAAWVVNARDPSDSIAPYSLWFGNWIVAAFTIVLFGRTAKSIPRQLEDSARLDGLGAFGTWRHATFPFFTRDLALAALFTVMATLLPFWGCITAPEAGGAIVLFQRFLSPSGRIAMMALTSAVGALPLLAIFFLTRPRR
ncbi:MAG TPA: hypothetical protein VJS88_02050 [Chthoniobacterales bacterium]|nr:hypothetical protein [Chthoniobacterales bacterium]